MGEPVGGVRQFRDDIQALRAIAVLLVVVSHVVGWPSGGFVGVDVFFVISGFLITQRLLDSDGSVGSSLLDFYRRRARRILPAAVVVILATVLLAQLLFSAGRAARVANDALWSLAFGANLHFGFQGTDYFESGGPVSPLQHYWSLAVEEQFYLAWPLLLLVLLALTRARSRRARRHTALVVALVVVCSSFGWSWYQTSTSPVAAYFATPARAWEIGAGAVLAAGGSWLSPASRRAREVLGALGVAGIALAAVVLGPGSHFPGPAAALPVLAAVAYLAAGSGGDGATHRLRAHRFLVNDPVLRVGALSFSLYLWHWPALVFVESLTDLWVLRVFFTLLATFALSELTYRVVEQPFLRGRPTPRATRRRWGAIILAGTAVLVLAVPHASLSRPIPAVASADGLPELTGTPEQMSADLAAELEEAMASQSFPELVPPLEDPYAGIFEGMTANQCLNPSDQLAQATCTYRPEDSTGRDAIVIGDSIANAWLPGVREALGPLGWTVRAVTFSSCPPALTKLELADNSVEKNCRLGLASALEVIEDERPDLVIGSSHQGSLPAVQAAPGDPDPWTTYVAGLTSVGEKVRSTGAAYVLLGPAPAGPRALDCAGAFGTPMGCVTSVRGDFEGTITAFGAAATAGGFGYIDTTGWFCGAFGCPIYAAGRLIRWDNAHMTQQYVEYLAPLLREALLVHVPE